jgi:hypothetical protein
MQEVNKLLDKHEKTQKELWLCRKNGRLTIICLTPTLKVKRNVLEKDIRHRHYEKWYKDANIVVWEN